MIIAITGTNGSGKGTVVEYLKSKGFQHYSARDFIVAEIERRALRVDRPTMHSVANSMREKHGPTYVIASLLTKAAASQSNALIESIRVPAEVELLKSHGAILIGTDAERRMRYERIVARDSATDKIPFDQFCAEEDAEMHSSDPTHQSGADVMAKADYIIQNDGTLAELHAKVDEILTKLQK